MLPDLPVLQGLICNPVQSQLKCSLRGIQNGKQGSILFWIYRAPRQLKCMLRKNFYDLRFLHPSIHKKALKSLTSDCCCCCFMISSNLLPFHTVHGVLKARIVKSFAIPYSSGPYFVRTLHYDPSILGGPTQNGSQH